MKYCEKCGSPVNEGAEYCATCGAKMEVVNSVSTIVQPEFNYDNVGVKGRSIALAIIFTILTCGLYSIYWMIKINDDSLKLAREKGASGVVVFLLTLLTCGIYGYFWAYKMGACVDKIKGNQNGITGLLYVVLSLLGLSIVNYVISQDAINNTIK